MLFQTTAEFKKLVNLLIFTIKTQSPEMAFHAAVSLGRLCVVEPVSKSYLISRLPGLSPHEKGEVGPVVVNLNFKKKHGLEEEIQGIPSLCEETLINRGRGGLPAENLDR